MLLLAAEVERCNAIRPGNIWGSEPEDELAAFGLAAMGFHKAIGIDPPRELDIDSGFVQIVAGTADTEDVARKLAPVADLALETWGDQRFANRVHGALNEALTNVIMHAYDPAFPKAAPASDGRWWIAGYADEGQATFLALDHGVGIPVSAPLKNRGVQSYLSEFSSYTDEQVIFSVVADEGRSRTGLQNHGKGIPAMIALVKDLAESGMVWIVSGQGAYLLIKEAAKPPLPARIYGIPVKYAYPLAGTLIVWKVGRPIVGEQSEKPHDA